jgi:hypothetical protein
MIKAKRFALADVIHIHLLGFIDEAEEERLAKMFTQTKSGVYKWQVVDNIQQATMLLIAAMHEGDLTPWLAAPYDFTPIQLIAYSPTPLLNARWHFARPPANRIPSYLDFFKLVKQINEVSDTEKPSATKPLKTLVNAQSPLATVNKSAVKPLATTIAGVENFKILFVGSVGSGKTTAIQTLADGKVLTTETMPSDHAQLLKKTTTVAMDYAPLELDKQRRVHIYGAPGQRRFDFMSDILSYNAIGLVILVSNGTSKPLLELNYYLNQHRRFLNQRPAIIGVTHNDLNPKPSLKEYRQFLEQIGAAWPVFKVDARSKADMLSLIEGIFAQQPTATLDVKAVSEGYVKDRNSIRNL